MPWQPETPPHLLDDSNLGGPSLGASHHGLSARALHDQQPRQTRSHLEKPNSIGKTLPPGHLDGPTLKKSTASDLARGDTTSRFTCPLEGCSTVMPARSTLSDLWSHCSDKRHRKGLFQQDHIICEIGCQEGFADVAHLQLHYSKFKCTFEPLSTVTCPVPGCPWTLKDWVLC
jgi:hypothetical protein